MKTTGVSRRGFTFGAVVLEATALLAPDARADVSSDDTIQEVVVSARRTNESLLKVPESITAFDGSALSKLDIQSFQDIAEKVPNLSFQYGGAGLGYGASRSIAIRGISGANTTGFYIDDTPVPENIDPQILDLEGVEVLKGPQGTLYGEGSMGGNVRLRTKAPEFKNDIKFSTSAGWTDHAATPDGRATVVGNVDAIDNVLAVRAVGFVEHEGGFIQRRFPDAFGAFKTEDNQGADVSYGGSISTLLKVNDSFSATARIMAQKTDGHGLPVAFAPLPDFAVKSLTLERSADVQESYTDRWYMPTLELKYVGHDWELTSSSSYFNRHVYNLEDGTEGTQAALAGDPYDAPPAIFAGGVAWPQTNDNSNVYEELRASWAGNQYIHTIFGAFYSNKIMKFENGSQSFQFPALVTSGVYDSSLLWDNHTENGVKDRSLFGEVYLTAAGFELTLGARQFWLNESASSSAVGFVELGEAITPTQTTSEHGTNPKVSLSYSFSNDTIAYASASKGFRPGSANPPLPAACDAGLAELGLTATELNAYHSDSLWNYELGAKTRVDGISITAAAFQMRWANIQQALSVPVCFLPVIANAGAAKIWGGELEASGRLAEGLDMRLAFGYQSPKISELGLTSQLPGSRIFQVPDYTASAALTYERPLTAGIEGVASIDYSYTGNSYSNTTTSLYGGSAAQRAGYGILNARLGARQDKFQYGLYLKNLTNSRANLGDINPIAYPPVDASTGLVIPRVAVMRPFQLGLEFSYGF